MCQIIVSREGAPTLSRRTLQKLIEANPHGGGIAIASDGQLVVRRHRFPSPDILQAWLAEAPADATVVLHLRYATCGAVDDANVQPFFVGADGQYAFAHNGTLAGWGTDRCSDSATLASRVLCPVADAGLDRRREELAAVWHSGNRFVLMDGDGTVVLVGEQEGVWRGRAWWSNPKQLF